MPAPRPAFAPCFDLGPAGFGAYSLPGHLVSPGPGPGGDAAADDDVRRRARSDVARLIADATGLRRVVELARDELRKRGGR